MTPRSVNPVPEPEKAEESFTDGLLSEEMPAIVNAIRDMLKQGYSDEMICRIVGCTQKMVDKARLVMDGVR